MSNWQRTFWAVWFANFVAAAGMQSFLPFFPSHVERLGVADRADVALWSGLIFGAAPFSAAFMTPIWGALGDRFGRKLMVVRALLGLTVFVGLMSLAKRPEHLFLLRLGQGMFSGFMAPSITLVSFSAPPGKQGRITGSLQVSVAIGAMAGPLIGATFGSQVGMAPLFLSVAAAALVGAVVILRFASEPDVAQRAVVGEVGVAGVLRGTLRDLRDVMTNHDVRNTVILLFVLTFSYGASKPLMEIFVRDVVGEEGAVRNTGLLATLMALASTLTLRGWGSWSDAHGHGRALAICASISALALCGHSLAWGFASLVVLQLALGFGLAGASPSSYGLAGDAVPEERRGGAFGVLFGARTLAMATSAWAGGYLERHLGLRGLFVAGGGAVLLALIFLRPRRRDRAPEDPASALARESERAASGEAAVKAS
ncbi:MAG: MFS transporter [Planctomycetes bacterium]|nr:MFS transporter [Planctomycetota bacterium]MCB9903671.1 MFS transporter [Planctomycetota bacterium]